MDKPQIIIHATKSLNITLYDVKWIPRSARFVVLGSHPRQTGALQVYEMDQGEPKLIQEVEKKEAFKCGTFGAASLKQRDLATGDFSGNMRIWNLEKMERPVYSVAAHKEIINCIDGVGGLGIGEGAPELATGSRDGAVKIWDPRQKDKPVACMEPADGESKRDCWTVAFGHAHNDEDRCVAAGYDNGDIKLFDLRNMSLRWETNIRNGAHKSTVWCARHLPQNRDVFMTCGGSGTLNLWKYEYPTSRVQEDSNGVKKGVMGSVSLLQSVGVSSQPIAAFDWSPDKAGLCVCSSFDQCVRVLIVTKLGTL